MKKPKKRNKKYTPRVNGGKTHMAVVTQIILASIEDFFTALRTSGEAIEHEGRLWIKRVGEDSYDPADTTLEFIRDAITVVVKRLKSSFTTPGLDKMIQALYNKEPLTQSLIEDAFKDFEAGRKYFTQVTIKEFRDILITAEIKYYTN